jgi:flagellar hook-basal body complex protein FliE
MQIDLLASAAKAALSLTAAPSPDNAAAAFRSSLDPVAGAGGPGAAPFAGVLEDAMGNLRDLERQASGAVEGLVAGRGVDIHAAMIATQKSDLAFEMALAVRGKIVAAYQSMMGVQF